MTEPGPEESNPEEEPGRDGAGADGEPDRDEVPGRDDAGADKDNDEGEGEGEGEGSSRTSRPPRFGAPTSPSARSCWPCSSWSSSASPLG